MTILSSLRHSLLLGAVCAVSFSSGAFAQTSTGTLHGQVLDPSGAAVAGATVSVAAASGISVDATSDKQGNYVVRDLAPGTYSVTVIATGFTVLTKDNISIAAGQTATLNLPLDIEVEKQQVTVEAQGATVDTNPDNNASSVVLKGKDLDALSDDPDELNDELQALAGPAAGPNGGQMYIDGFTGGQLPPKSSIREIRVNQNPFSAEYDRPGYGRIEVFTKPGTDKFHGSVMFNENNSIFNSSNPFASGVPDYHSEMYNANVGGPLSKKASFFFNYERRDIQNEAVVNAFVLDNNFLPTPLSETVASPQHRTNVGPRIDYQLTATNTLTARYQYLQNDQQGQGLGQFTLPTQAFTQNADEHTVQLSDTQVLGAKVVNETRFQFDRTNTAQDPVDTTQTVSVLGAFTGGGSSTGVQRVGDDHYEIQNYTSVAQNKHFIRFGARIRVSDETEYSTSGFNGQYTFSSLDAYRIMEQGLAQGLSMAQIQAMDGGPSQFSIVTGTPTVSNDFVDTGLYAEDDWQVRKNLTLSYGLRFETQNDFRDHGDWAPRIGLAWGLDGGKSGTPKTVLRAGYGLFYDRFDQSLVLDLERFNGLTTQQYVVARPEFFGAPPADLGVTPSVRTIQQASSTLRAPYTSQVAVGLERQLGRVGTLTLNYLNSRGVHQFVSLNVNAPLPGTYVPTDPTSGARPLGDIGNVYQFASEGIFKQNQLITNFNLRGGAKYSFFGFYALNFANADTAGATSFPMNQYDLSADYGPTATDVRHRLFIGGTWSLPWQLRLSPFVMAHSGQPFTITVGQDLNGDSIFNDRPGIVPAGTTGPEIVATKYGTFDLRPTPGMPIVGPFSSVGPANFTFNLRASKTFGLGKKVERASNGADAGSGGHGGHGGAGGFGGGGPRGGGRGGSGGGPFGGGPNNNGQRYSLTFTVAARNLFNNVNLATPIGNLNSPYFGQSINLANQFGAGNAYNRRIDLQVMFSF